MAASGCTHQGFATGQYKQQLAQPPRRWPRRDHVPLRGGHSVISRSSAGADYEAGPDRVLLTAGDVELARLHTGESYEMAVTTDRGVSCTVRWTHQ